MVTRRRLVKSKMAKVNKAKAQSASLRKKGIAAAGAKYTKMGTTPKNPFWNTAVTPYSKTLGKRMSVADVAAIGPLPIALALGASAVAGRLMGGGGSTNGNKTK